MRIPDTSTPVVVVECKLAALAIMRSLGSLGVPVYGVDGDARSPGMLSRYCRKKFIRRFHRGGAREFLDYLLEVRQAIGRPSLLIPTSDETAEFVAEYAEELSRHFIFPRNDPALVRSLASKRDMYHLAVKHGVPTPRAAFPASLTDVVEYAEDATYPVMLKGIDGHRLEQRTGKRMVLASSRAELLENYKVLADGAADNLMLQEYIPGGDDQVYIFNGYFDSHSRCLAGFTGRKIRQHPVH